MPSGLIQPRLPGFLDLLQLKNNGRQPPLLGDEVQLTMDVGSWYGLDNVKVELSSAYAMVTNNFVNVDIVRFTVPVGQYWAIYGAAVQLNFDPTATKLVLEKFVPYAQRPENSSMVLQLADGYQFDSTKFTVFPGVAGYVVGGAKWWDRPVMLPPGSNVGLSLCGELTDPAGTGSARCAISYLALNL